MLLAEVGISVLIICKFSNKWTCTRKKEVEGLSCGFEEIVKSADNDSMSDIVEIEKSINESGLPELDIVSMLLDIDDLDGLVYEYGEDVPEDHDSEEFQNWYDDNYARIYSELEEINNNIEIYLSNIDAKYGTHWCPTGALRV